MPLHTANDSYYQVGCQAASCKVYVVYIPHKENAYFVVKTLYIGQQSIVLCSATNLHSTIMILGEVSNRSYRCGSNGFGLCKPPDSFPLLLG